MAGIRFGVLFVGVLVSAVSTGTSSSALTKPQVISVVEVAGQVTTDPPDLFSRTTPPPVGSRAFLINPIYAWAGKKRGDRIGRIEIICTFTDFTSSAIRSSCSATAFLPAGKIMIAGSPRFFPNAPTDVVLAVVGGTGRYSNARGWARIKDIGPVAASIVFHLTP